MLQPASTMQEGLVGNRTVSRGDVWGLVTAATRAFPIQLSPSVEKAQEVLAAGAANGSTLLHTWIIQVSFCMLHVWRCMTGDADVPCA